MRKTFNSFGAALVVLLVGATLCAGTYAMAIDDCCDQLCPDSCVCVFCSTQIAIPLGVVPAAGFFSLSLGMTGASDEDGAVTDLTFEVDHPPRALY
ncbi:MAG TPA: hypothetical protein VN285_13235 [Candidatus Deferrimicrobium sp.]|nr:hypothetical protein [Candidatus Deferrimicrobium sp.]